MAKLKVKKLSYVIDHVQEIVSDAYLLSAYGKLQMTSSHIVQNVLNIRRAAYNHMINMYHWSATKRNRLTLVPLAHIFNAFYHPGLNSIAIPSGIAHGSIYSHNQEAYLNFGAIGIIIGHELSHVFDNVGRLYDAKGNYINWWSNQSNSNFEQKSRCFIKQYDDFWLGPNLKINGTLTLGENMADSGGTLLAYRAYLKWKKKYLLRKLPGLEKFTLRQMFWITVGNTWCDKLRPETLEMFLKTDVHSVGNFRVQGPLLNSKDFFRDFNCHTRARMNYYKKCTIW